MYNIEECEEYLLNIPKFKKKTLLSDTLKFYELLGSPGKNIKKYMWPVQMVRAVPAITFQGF